MSFSMKSDVTPEGLRITRLDSSGRITESEAAAMMKALSPGGEHHGLPLLVVSEPGTEVTADARRVFTTGIVDDLGLPAAIVSASVVLRVTVNFISRVNGNPRTRL